MPSGNATITYTGDEPTITFSGETFVKGEPTHSADQGVIGAAKTRDDFTVVDYREGEAPATSSEAVSPESQTLPEAVVEAPKVAAKVAAKVKKAAPKKH